MTNPNDQWRHQQSAAPHAPSHDVQTPGLPLQRQDATSFSSAGGGATSVGDSGGAGVLLALALVSLLFAAPIFGTLYPVAAGSALVAGLATYGVLAKSATNLSPDGRLPFTLLAAAIVFWTVSRLDHRLAARVMPYRLIRHIVRIVLIAGFLSVTSLNEFGSGSWPRSIGQLGVLTGDRRLLLLLVVFAVFAQWLLTRAKTLRAMWHTLLEIVRLRPYGLDES